MDFRQTNEKKKRVAQVPTIFSFASFALLQKLHRGGAMTLAQSTQTSLVTVALANLYSLGSDIAW